MVSSIINILTLSCAIRQASAAFSLNTGGPNWDYTTKDLASTTSQACKDAYSASIDCDDILVGMAASLNPNFDVQASDLQSLCTTTCSDSLAQYIANVTSACNQPGDLSGLCSGNKNLFQAPVAATGEYLQYKYGEACAMNGSDYCFLTYSSSQDWAREDFPCNDTCAIQFYQNAHDQPGSAYFFSYMDLCNQTSYWEETFAGGWETVVQCGDGGNQTTTTSSTSVSVTTSVSSSLGSASTTISSASEVTSAASSTGSTTGSSASTAVVASSRPTSGAARIKPPFIFLF